MAEEGSLSQQILDQIIDRAEGVPLFIEELTTSILSAPRQSRPQNGGFEGTTPIGDARVPETLHDALMERLDRVTHGRQLAQIAAVIGREFSYDLLTVASRTDETDLRSTLSRDWRPPISSSAPAFYRRCVFPSNMRCCATRSTIPCCADAGRRFTPTSPRCWQTHFRELTDNRPEILAYHYSEAGSSEKAIRYWREAGRRAIAKSANVEAISHLRSALHHLGTLPDTA